MNLDDFLEYDKDSDGDSGNNNENAADEIPDEIEHRKFQKQSYLIIVNEETAVIITGERIIIWRNAPQ